jgi:hypothetical protein
MMLRAPETGALYEGYAQKGFGVPSLALDGSPGRWAPQPPMKPRDVQISVGEVEVPRCHRAKNPVDQEAKQNKLISAIINNHRGTSGFHIPQGS